MHGPIPVVTISVEGHTNELVVEAGTEQFVSMDTDDPSTNVQVDDPDIDKEPPAVTAEEDVPIDDNTQPDALPADVVLPSTSGDVQTGATNKMVRVLQKMQPTDKLM